MSHPALDTVLWTPDERSRFRVERARYKGHALRVRHTGGPFNLSIGFVDDKAIGSRPNMEQTCELLFAYVDRLESDAA